MFRNTQRKTFVLKVCFFLMEPVFLFNNVAGLKACSFIKKEPPTQVFSCEYCKGFSISFFYRAPPLAALDQILNKDHGVYFDNYLTSIPLLQHLKIQRVRHNSYK